MILFAKCRFGNVKLDGWWGDEGSSGKSDRNEKLKQLAIFEFRIMICDMWNVKEFLPLLHLVTSFTWTNNCQVSTNRSNFINDFAPFYGLKKYCCFVKRHYEHHYHCETLVRPWPLVTAMVHGRLLTAMNKYEQIVNFSLPSMNWTLRTIVQCLDFPLGLPNNLRPSLQMSFVNKNKNKNLNSGFLLAEFWHSTKKQHLTIVETSHEFQT